MYTVTEKVIIGFIKRGWPSKEIGQELSIKENSVKFHLTHIYKKAGVKSRAEFLTRYISKENLDE